MKIIQYYSKLFTGVLTLPLSLADRFAAAANGTADANATAAAENCDILENCATGVSLPPNPDPEEPGFRRDLS